MAIHSEHLDFEIRMASNILLLEAGYDVDDPEVVDREDVFIPHDEHLAVMDYYQVQNRYLFKRLLNERNFWHSACFVCLVPIASVFLIGLLSVFFPSQLPPKVVALMNPSAFCYANRGAYSSGAEEEFDGVLYSCEKQSGLYQWVPVLEE